jgi:hypothetical protein
MNYKAGGETTPQMYRRLRREQASLPRLSPLPETPVTVTTPNCDSWAKKRWELDTRHCWIHSSSTLDF